MTDRPRRRKLKARKNQVDPLTSAYLQWMCDNQPDYVRGLLQTNQIGELDRVLWVSVDPAWKFYHQRRKEGKEYAEAIDLAMEALIPREFQDPMPEPLSQEDQILVRQKLDAREEGKQKLQALQEKRLRKSRPAKL